MISSLILNHLSPQYDLALDDRIHVKDDDKLGLTILESEGPVAFRYTQAQQGVSINMAASQTPEVGQDYSFSSQTSNRKFALAVETRKNDYTLSAEWHTKTHRILGTISHRSGSPGFDTEEIKTFSKYLRYRFKFKFQILLFHFSSYVTMGKHEKNNIKNCCFLI